VAELGEEHADPDGGQEAEGEAAKYDGERPAVGSGRREGELDQGAEQVAQGGRGE
jgi:hypothetical protein